MKLRARPAGALLVLAGLTACDIPTGIPRWETTWITPGETMTVGVAELLPGGLAVTPDSSAFVLGFDPVNESWSLGELCSLCPAATALKPPFTTTVSATMPLPTDVRSIDVTGGDIDIVLTNGLSFDPIRPGTASDSGSITITVRSGAATVASLVIDGATQAFPPGTDLPVTLAFAASTIADDLQFEFTVDSPAGDVTTMSPSDSIGVTIMSQGVLVSEATVALASQPISGAETELDLSGVSDIVDRVREGTLFMEIVNPFSLTGTLELTFDPEPTEERPDPSIVTKQIALQAGTTEQEVTFTETEIQQLVGTTSALTVGGVVSAIGGEVTVRPDMVISVTTRLRVTVELGGDSEGDSGS